MFLRRTSTVLAALLLAGGAAMLSVFAGPAMASASSPVQPGPSIKATGDAIARKPLRFVAGPGAMRARGARRVGRAIKSPRTSSSLPTWTWINRNSNKCLGVSGGNMTNGTPIVQYTCNGHLDQQWVQIPLNGNYYHFQNGANNNKCLGVPGASQNSDVQLVIWDCLSHPDQLWSAMPDLANTGCYWLQNGNSALFVGVRGGSLLNSAAVVQFDFVPGALNQEWC